MTFRKISTEDLVLIARPGRVQRLVGITRLHAEELTEEIDEAGGGAVAFDCGTGRD